jgi:hypothetical protein
VGGQLQRSRKHSPFNLNSGQHTRDTRRISLDAATDHQRCNFCSWLPSARSLNGKLSSGVDSRGGDGYEAGVAPPISYIVPSSCSLIMRALGVFSKSLAVARAVAPVRASVRFASTAKATPGSKGRVVLLYR